MPRPRKPRTFADYNDILTVDEAAELLRVDRDTVYAEIHRGRIPAYRIGRKMRISKNVIKNLLGDSMPPETVNNQSNNIDIQSNKKEVA